MTTALKPGDVVCYEPENRWCHDGYAIAEKRRDGQVVLVDTYWSSGASLGAVEPLVYEHLFNLAEYDVKPASVWETFAPADRRYIPKHSGYQTVHLVRKGAKPDLATQVENARERVSEAEDKVRSAKWSLKFAQDELARLEAQSS